MVLGCSPPPKEIVEELMEMAVVDDPEHLELCIEGERELVNRFVEELIKDLRPAYISLECSGGVVIKKVVWCGGELVIGVRSLRL